MTVKELLQVMVKSGASDLYLTVDSPPMFRVEGITKPYGEVKLTSNQSEEIALTLMSEKQKAVFSEMMEMNLSLYYPEIGRFRVNMFRQKGFVGIVFRQIKLDIESLDDLNLPSILKDICLTKRGLVLLVGGTGTGKSTTLAAMIDYRNSNTPGHIVTIEDPVEFMHRHKKCIVTQREIGTDTLGYSEALKNTLRQAPDVILIGEVRDMETMEAAVAFAETGHLCFSTLHANNANQAIERIMNFFPPEKHNQLYFQLGLNLKAIISQRLIPTVDNKRAAAIEILIDTPRVKDLIMKRKIDVLKEAMSAGTREGMQTFDQAVFDIYKTGRISYENAIAYADSANDLRLRIKMDEIGEKGEEKVEEDKLKGPDETFRIKADSPTLD
jgi:twitching motility protein PilU